MNNINKLSQEVINQIAAGEVIERPSSIIKELIDNSIDAKSTKISISITDGGISNITVNDNGVGISKENLIPAFEAHSTSKLKSINDLNELLTMGFRGEALSTIVSIANVIVISRTDTDEFGYKLEFNGITPLDTVKAPHDRGTTISVSNIFYNIPARKKFLKTPETEYRKILDILIQYFLIYPNIHWILTKDGKEIFNLPQIQELPGINTQRIKKVLKSNWVEDSNDISTESYGMKTEMLIAHPKYNTDKTNEQYIFINNRPVKDNGITRSIIQGYQGFIPQGRRIPYLISINISPKLIDVNAHPRKEEIRFENPYRIYSYITDLVSQNLKSEIKEENSNVMNYNSKDILQPSKSYSQPLLKDSGIYNRNNNEINFNNNKSYSVKQSIEFSKKALEYYNTNEESSKLPTNTNEIVKAIQIFNKYIIIEFKEELRMIDQHAAAERITFEKLKKQYNGLSTDIQNTLVPIEIILNEIEVSYIQENIEFLNKLGFHIDINNNILLINSFPAYINNNQIEETIRALVENIDSNRDMETKLDDVLATIACHSSIRKGQSLSNIECISIYNQLIKCDIPYSCPHGRPAIWKLKLTEIDTNFYRTY